MTERTLDVPEIFAAHASIVIARFSPTRALLYGNTGFHRLSRASEVAPWELFLQPRLDQIAASAAEGPNPAYSGRMTLGDPEGDTHTLVGDVRILGGDLLIVAGYDIDEFERIAIEFRELNNELEQAHRALVQANRELARREKIIHDLSLTDALTGLGNRRRLDDTLATEVARAVRYETPLALVMIDIDHFKTVNDTWGHEAGDTVLRGLGELLGKSLRQVDSAARLGGEEFVLLMPEATLEQAESAADRLRQRIAAQAMGVAGKVTASFGVAVLGAGETGTELLARADAALYAAKRTGRNRVARAMPPAASAGQSRDG